MDNAEAEGMFLLYEQDGVLLTTKGISGDSSKLFLGKLRIIKERTGTFITWMSDDVNASLPPSQETDWTVIDPNQGSAGYHSQNTGRPINFEVDDLKCICLSSLSENNEQAKKSTGFRADPGRTCGVTFVQTDGTTHSSLIFPGGSTAGLLDALTRHLELKRSCQDDSMILCEPKVAKPKRDPYERSLAELRLFPDRNPSSMHSLNYSRLGHLGQIGVGAWRFVNDLKRDPYATTMTAFSKISDYLLHEDERPHEEIVELLQRSLSLDETQSPIPVRRNHHATDGDESGFLVGSSDSSVEGYELIQPPVADLIPRPKTTRGQPLTEKEWEAYFDEEGRIAKSLEIRAKIFSGGIDPSIRSEVWKFLLGYYPWSSSLVERKELRDAKKEEYYRMKLQWKTFTVDQESRFAPYKQRKDLIEKDVNRTDRTVSFYAGDGNQNVATLRDILMTYMMYNFDLGYVQGMSDLLAPILFVIEDELDAFWCFVAYMDRVNRNFELDQSGIKRQLSQLRALLHTVDPHLASYLDTRDSGNLFFCFRWLLVLFKREFNYPQILRLWEVFWTDGPFFHPTRKLNDLEDMASEDVQSSLNFHLLMALSIMDSQRNTILENRFGFTEILKHVNDLALYIDLEETLAKSEAIFLQIKDSPSVTKDIRSILGLEDEGDRSESNSTVVN